MQDQNVFAGAFVDRIGERRKDPAWLAAAAVHPDSRFVPVRGEQCLLDEAESHAVLLDRRQLGPSAVDEDLIFLGLFRDRPVFAVPVPAEGEAAFAALGTFRDLRYLGTILPADEANLVAHARALVLWHASQVHCGRCGAAARPQAGGNSRMCTNPACRQVLFPRVDPAIIVLVANGDRCLLGRQASWPEGRYSTIAGFVEPGESVEDAVRREVYEETNVRVGEVRYHSSQPWPFPSSLMLGFVAEAVSADILLNDAELEDARWVTRAELLGDGLPKLPFRISISRRLVDYWIGLGDA
jgi:NAD+ diphosphatase